jgi:hypothetical protein
MIPVKSSQIAAVDYDGLSLLTVQFNSGSTYQYQGVPPEKYAALMSAESVGAFFGKNIKGQHDYTKLEEKKNEL